jgi:hypothetical protein
MNIGIAKVIIQEFINHYEIELKEKSSEERFFEFITAAKNISIDMPDYEAIEEYEEVQSACYFLMQNNRYKVLFK